MSTSQIVLIIFAAFVLYLYVKRYLRNRSVKNYEPSEAAELLKSNFNTVLLDVRTPKERKEQHIKGSLHIPLYELKSRSGELKKYKDKEIICYCRSGNRSITAAAILHKQGFNSANMKGGIIKWNQVSKK